MNDDSWSRAPSLTSNIIGRLRPWYPTLIVLFGIACISLYDCNAMGHCRQQCAPERSRVVDYQCMCVRENGDLHLPTKE